MGTSANYYRHSGKVSIPGLAIGTVASLAAAVGLAFVYAYTFAYLPIIGYVSFLLALGFGLAIGFVVHLAMHLGKVRSGVVVTLVTILVTAVGYYMAWAIWIHVVVGRGTDLDIPIGELAGSPSLMWTAIDAINETGTWSMHGFTPKGGFLWVAWLVELVLIAGPAIFIGRSGLDDTVFCESCNSWCIDGPPVEYAIADPAVMAAHLEHGNLQALSEMAPRGPDDLAWMRTQVTACAARQNCKATHTVSLSMVTFTVDDEGKATEKAERYVDRMIIDRASAEQLGAPTV